MVVNNTQKVGYPGSAMSCQKRVVNSVGGETPFPACSSNATQKRNHVLLRKVKSCLAEHVLSRLKKKRQQAIR